MAQNHKAAAETAARPCQWAPAAARRGGHQAGQPSAGDLAHLPADTPAQPAVSPNRKRRRAQRGTTFVNADPGAMTGSLPDFVRTWNAQREVTVRGLHFMPEDSPHEIGRAAADWLAAIP
jgi:hypothetical protein